MSMKNSNYTTGNRTGDLPVCSAVPEPTAPPRAPIFLQATRIHYTECAMNKKAKCVILPERKSMHHVQ